MMGVDWYLDWAKIALTVVRTKRHRIRMGFSQPTQGETDVESPAGDGTVVPTPMPGAEPTPMPGVAPTPGL